jgi:hypothetical protein
MKGSHSISVRAIPVILVCMLLVVLPVLACASSPVNTSHSYETSPEVPMPPAPAPEPVEAPGFGIAKQTGGEALSARDYDDSDIDTIDRKIIKSGNITLVVDDIVVSIDAISDMANELGGYVVSSNKYQSNNDRLSGMVTIRVPAERFDDAFDRLRGLAIDVPYENTRSVDVTEEYTDLEAQLHNLEATEAQYLSLLEKAETVEDILKVQQELSNVRGQIERIKGRMQYLDRTSDMSLIEISLEEKKSIEKNGWKASDTLLSAVRGFLTFLKALANILIWVAIFCPIWIPIVIVLVRWRRKKAKAGREKQQTD